MPNLDDLFSQVDAALDAILALGQALVRIPSVNTGFMPTGDETPVCEYVRDWLAEDGISSEILEAAPNRGNIIARLEGRSGKAGLMFMSHTDGVPVEGESKWRFPPVEPPTPAAGGHATRAAHPQRSIKRPWLPLEEGEPVPAPVLRVRPR